MGKVREDAKTNLHARLFLDFLVLALCSLLSMIFKYEEGFMNRKQARHLLPPPPVYGHTKPAMHKPSTPPPPPPFLEGCSLPLNRLADHLTALRACLVQATSAWFVKTRHAPSRHSRDARVYGHTTTAMHKLSTPPRPPPSCGSSIHGVRADLSRRGADRGYNPPENRPDDAGIFYALFDDLVRLVCIGGKPGFMWFALTPAGGRSTEGNQNLRGFP